MADTQPVVPKSLVERAKDAVGSMSNAYPVRIDRFRVNSVCCDNEWSTIPYVGQNARVQRVFVPLTVVAATSLTFPVTTIPFLTTMNGDPVPNFPGLTTQQSENQLDENGALCPSGCAFALLGISADAEDPLILNNTTGVMTIPDWTTSEENTYAEQIKQAFARGCYPSVKQTGNSCLIIYPVFSQLPNDSGYYSHRTGKVGLPYTNQIPQQPFAIAGGGTADSRRLQGLLNFDRSWVIANHAGNPIPAVDSPSVLVLPVLLKFWGTLFSVEGMQACA